MRTAAILRTTAAASVGSSSPGRPSRCSAPPPARRRGAPPPAGDRAEPRPRGGSDLCRPRAQAGYRLCRRRTTTAPSCSRTTRSSPAPSSVSTCSTSGRPSGTLTVEAGLRGADDWEARPRLRTRRGRGSPGFSTQKFTHAREHEALPRDYEVRNRPHGSEFMGESEDADPGAEYADTLYNTQASLKVRVPGLSRRTSRASGRVFEHKGSQQMIYFFRSCSTELCHVNSRTRTLDQVTQEYTPRRRRPRRSASTSLRPHLPHVPRPRAGPRRRFRRHHVPAGAVLPGRRLRPRRQPRPALASRTPCRLNTNLTNRAVVSLAYARQEQENETSGITRGDQRAALEASYLVVPGLFAVAHLDYERERTLELSDEARALRVKNNESTSRAARPTSTPCKPEYDRAGAATLGLRIVPRAGALFHLRAGTASTSAPRSCSRSGDSWDDGPQTSATTLAALDGRWRFGRGARARRHARRRSGPRTRPTRSRARASPATGSGATWTPGPRPHSVRARLRGIPRQERRRGSPREGLREAQRSTDEGFSRDQVDGNAVNVLAAYTPAPAFTLTAAYTYCGQRHRAGHDVRDARRPAKLGYLSPDTTWSGRTQVANLRAVWAATERLKLTAEGVWVSGRESYDPNFAADADLEELGTVEFTKLLRLAGGRDPPHQGRRPDADGFLDRVTTTTQEEEGDGHALGILAAIDVRW